MVKKIVIAIMMLTLLPILGCEELTGLTEGMTQTSASTGPKILKSVELGSAWEMKQMRFDVAAGDEVSILLKLSDADKVDGYFYLEKGEDINFRITGKTQLDWSTIPDRFSFVAEQAQGDTYTLAFRNPADEDETAAKVTVFLEVIYPLNASLYIPVEGEWTRLLKQVLRLAGDCLI